MSPATFVLLSYFRGTAPNRLYRQCRDFIHMADKILCDRYLTPLHPAPPPRNPIALRELTDIFVSLLEASNAAMLGRVEHAQEFLVDLADRVHSDVFNDWGIPDVKQDQ